MEIGPLETHLNLLELDSNETHPKQVQQEYVAMHPYQIEIRSDGSANLLDWDSNETYPVEKESLETHPKLVEFDSSEDTNYPSPSDSLEWSVVVEGYVSRNDISMSDIVGTGIQGRQGVDYRGM